MNPDSIVAHTARQIITCAVANRVLPPWNRVTRCVHNDIMSLHSFRSPKWQFKTYLPTRNKQKTGEKQEKDKNIQKHNTVTSPIQFRTRPNTPDPRGIDVTSAGRPSVYKPPRFILTSNYPVTTGGLVAACRQGRVHNREP